MPPPPTEKEVGSWLTEDSDAGRTAASSWLFENVIRISSRYPDFFDRKADIKQFYKATIEECVKLGEQEKVDCEHAFNNAVWTLCQELKKPPKVCSEYPYKTSAKDVFASRFFWGPFGLFMGILMVTMVFLVVYCVCLKKKKSKGTTGMTGKKGGSKEKGKFKGSGSQETPQTPGTDSKSPMVGNGNQKSPGGGGFGNGKKYQPGVSPNHETYMY